MIHIDKVSLSFGAFDVLHNVTMDAKQGQFISVIGPSGCGKSSLFKILIKIHRKFNGTVTINDQPLKQTDYSVGYMPQNDLLLEWKTIYENVILPFQVGKKENIDRDRVLHDIEAFGLKGFETFYPHQLSGGMKQRVSLLRTINMGSDLLLLDEPFAALDAITRHNLQKWLKELINQYQKTVLLVTHDIDEAIFLSDKVYVMSSRPGTIIKEFEIPFGSNRDHAIYSHPTFIDTKMEILSLIE